MLPLPWWHRCFRWLHDLRVGDYQAAAQSISGLVNSQPHEVGGAKRLLALSKAAAWGASPGWPSEVPANLALLVSDADTKTRLLELQVGRVAFIAVMHARLHARPSTCGLRCDMSWHSL